MGTQASTADKLVELIEGVITRMLPNMAISTINKLGIIKSLPNSDNEYTITINGEDYQNIPAKNGQTYSINDVVVLSMYNGNTQKMIIDYKKPKRW
ncbi:MAG TPA: hypothetical protein DCW51_06155 [Clostridium sp.]|nr:hypothetical protein [Clostridium sp.]